MKKILTVLMTILIIGALAVNVFAKIEVPGRTNSRVNDYAGVIDKDTKDYLEKMLSSIKQKTQDPVEVIVTTFKTLDGWDFREFSQAYGEKWRDVKRNKRDNGVIILVAINEGRVGIGVGRNLNDILTPAITTGIIQNTFLSAFSEAKYSEGLKKGTEEIVSILDKARIPSGNPLTVLLGILVVVGILLAVIFRTKKRGSGLKEL
jgi:uncharacterized protein